MIPTLEVSPEALVAIAGFVISLLFTYIPKLNTWYAGMSEDYKKLFMLVVLLITTTVTFVLGCSQLIAIENFTCGRQDLLNWIWMFVLSLGVNQGTHLAFPKPRVVKLAKERGKLMRGEI
jgi:hypothetical protein